MLSWYRARIVSNGVINTFVNTDDIAADNPKYTLLWLSVGSIDTYLYAHFDALLYNDIWIEILSLIQKYARIALIEVRMLSLKEWNHDKSQVYLNDK